MTEDHFKYYIRDYNKDYIVTSSQYPIRFLFDKYMPEIKYYINTVSMFNKREKEKPFIEKEEMEL